MWPRLAASFCSSARSVAVSVSVRPSGPQTAASFRSTLRAPSVRRAAVSAAQDELDAQQKFLREERFGQIIVRPEAQAEQPVGVGVAGREEQHRHLAARVEFAEQRKPVAVRQVDVKNDQLRHTGGKGPARCGAAARRAQAGIARPGQRPADQREQLGRIVHQKDIGILDALHTILPPLPYLIWFHYSRCAPRPPAGRAKFKAKLSGGAGGR